MSRRNLDHEVGVLVIGAVVCMFMVQCVAGEGRAPVRWALVVDAVERTTFEHEHRCEEFANVLHSLQPERAVWCRPIGGDQ